ncbi:MULTISPECIES: sensor domain-containing diguanylate cyclase [Pontibacillus]|uniref:Sensor domain-containing diguanylate cyclase n=1 Tax=Pontibacillus chungwhensis TaxID=265426 RepID=A0ABY8UZQ3_9BACI|nr:MULTISPECIES: sensor domain-containing diguanylate cyclase [Pontibacillus]MCD5323741.1 sensor domain-containing diguanylate cyclase [Pontibacillus sp. HN14]WIF97106.1 sensor domain-containing diguanylate cyclase [Pontibacillus chungwhensis]
MISKQKTVALWSIWAILWPGIIATVYMVTNPGTQGREFDLLSFAFMIVIVALFPIVINNSPIIFIHGISLAVFLYFGLFFEMIMTQLAYIVSISKVKLSRAYWYKLPLNLTMFLFVSLGSALFYYILGGTHGPSAFNTPSDAIPIIGYAVAQFILNHVVIYFVRNYFLGNKGSIFDKEFYWDLGNTAIVMPIGFVLYVLYMEIGAAAIYYVGLPFVGLSLILTLYYASQHVNEYLQQANSIGQELTGRLKVDEVLDRFVESLTVLFHVDYIYIFDRKNQDHLELIRYFDGGKSIGFQNPQFSSYEGVSQGVLAKGEPILYQSRKQWKQIQSDLIPRKVESIMSVPIERNNKIEGIITIASTRKRSYEKFHLMLVGILSNYMAVAIQNARHYEETKRKSELCPLTKLYNYRYFEDLVSDYADRCEQSEEEECASVILLDLDHFKKVNDAYGHESGNEALCELANRLSHIVGNDGTVARYGGEEFVAFLPGAGREKGLSIAEKLRHEISSVPFRLKEHITDQQGDIEVWLTGSVGVATFPEDCESPIELVRHADRAMYVGAKQQGRNKVASYERVLEAAE